MDQQSGAGPTRVPRNNGRGPEALQHPLTLGFLFLCGLAAIHWMGISPLPVEQWWGAILLLGAIAGAIVSFYWAYAIRYRSLPFHQHPGQEGPGEEVAGARDLAHLQSFLEEEFAALESDAGLKALAELKHEYEQVRELLDASESRDSLSVNFVPRLAEETYRQGLKVMNNALDLTRTIQSANRDKLEEEVAELESEIESFRRDRAPAERFRYKEETVNSHKERLSLLDQQQLRVDELLYQAELCEASLARAHIELAALHAGDSENRVNTVTDALQSTIDRAREVQEELRQMGL